MENKLALGMMNYDGADGLPYSPGVAGCSSGERDKKTLESLPDLGGSTSKWSCVYHDSRMSARGWEDPSAAEGVATHEGTNPDPLKPIPLTDLPQTVTVQKPLPSQGTPAASGVVFFKNDFERFSRRIFIRGICVASSSDHVCGRVE